MVLGGVLMDIVMTLLFSGYNNALRRYMLYDGEEVNKTSNVDGNKIYGFSVRCVRDY